MQSTHRGWVAVGVAALLGLHAMGAKAQRSSDTPPEKPMAPQSLYEAIAERVHVGGYAHLHQANK
jgi:hypothetical protein